MPSLSLANNTYRATCRLWRRGRRIFCLFSGRYRITHPLYRACVLHAAPIARAYALLPLCGTLRIQRALQPRATLYRARLPRARCCALPLCDARGSPPRPRNLPRTLKRASSYAEHSLNAIRACRAHATRHFFRTRFTHDSARATERHVL